MPTTPRWALPYPASTDPPAGYSELQQLALALDDVAKDDQGILSSRPVSSPTNPGKKGRYYMVSGDPTTGNNGILWRDNGTGWDQVGGAGGIVDTRANRPAANTVTRGTRFFASDQVAEWVSDGTSWLRVGVQSGETAITLAAAATSGKILLQGQAWPSTTGIYADLFAILGGATLPDMRQRVPVGRLVGDSDFGTLLAAGGEKTHVLTVPELAAHAHVHNSHRHEILVTGGGGAVSTPIQPSAGAAHSYQDLFDGEPGISDVTTTEQNAGGGGAHNNLQPFIVVNFEAKL